MKIKLIIAASSVLLFMATTAMADIIFPPPNLLPTEVSQCKKGGWETYGVFKNQGDCVSYVVTGGRNAPALGSL